MKAEYVNSFYQATRDVFNLMLDLETEKESLQLVEGVISRDANVILGVTGDLRGTIMFCFPREMTLEMVKIMSGMAMDEIDSFVSSALGEVANIIGGNALTLLSTNQYSCDIVPPQIFVGDYKSTSMSNEKALLLSLKTSIGSFDLVIYLKEK
ncbi:chemotaxis protein CheX [Heliorestis acidaminivorans]|uniref:Chemotaxis protein CheX n=1 Tax=Heliorestis acidaminivorans TaxID=553427 RepID=A0A6I0EV96_9FIRM|nr:chemotaxis protein CheX [Heliorestis acidaminivorans]KAB2954294.1 chemotaxis protein CheX [Heliorestis acidaminivorans]